MSLFFKAERSSREVERLVRETGAQNSWVPEGGFYDGGHLLMVSPTA